MGSEVTGPKSSKSNKVIVNEAKQRRPVSALPKPPNSLSTVCQGRFYSTRLFLLLAVENPIAIDLVDPTQLSLPHALQPARMELPFLTIEVPKTRDCE